MQNWSSESRSAIQDAFNSLRETIGRELQNEVDQRLKEDGQSRAFLEEELEILRNRSDEVDRLEDENRRLRTKLLQRHHPEQSREKRNDAPNPTYRTCDQSTNTDQPSNKPASNGIDPDEILRESQKLHRKYIALDRNYKTLMAGFRKRTEESKKWQEYAAKLEATISKLEEHSGKSCEPAIDRPRAASALSFTTEPETGRGPSVARSEPVATPTRFDSNKDASREDSTEGGSTEGGKDADKLDLPPLKPNANSAAEVSVKPEPSSDGPVFISERHVGKRKRSGDAGMDYVAHQRIKIESSNLSESEQPTTQQQQESMDLDEVGQKLSTPRKNRHFDVHRGKTTDPVYVRPDSVETPTTRPASTSAVLTPVNPNAVRRHEPKTTEKADQKGLAQGIGSLAEDGLVYKKSSRGESLGGQHVTPQPPGRLNRLLNMPSPEKTPAIVRSVHRPRGASRPVDEAPLFPERRQLPFTKEHDVTARESPSNRNHQDQPTTPTIARRSAQSRASAGTSTASPKLSLRSKPVESLRLDDFKINPKFNDGSDYAYSEVVRGKDDKAALPGCLADCCREHFRNMALGEQNDTSRRSAAADNKLFEDFLGDRISTVWGMSKEEKEALWLEAKTWELSNKLSRHRHLYSRRQSPPGFWDTDFPNTQKVEAERAEAEKREKQTIRERYMDAMRGGGRWVFRDE